MYNLIDKQDKYISHRLFDGQSRKFVYLNLIVHDQLMHIQNAFREKINVSVSDEKLTAVRVGKTQSNISQPSAEHITRSMANLNLFKSKLQFDEQTTYPTPIKYRGFSLGRNSVERVTIRQK